jgi:hypothetical protein
MTKRLRAIALWTALPQLEAMCRKRLDAAESERRVRVSCFSALAEPSSSRLSCTAEERS